MTQEQFEAITVLRNAAFLGTNEEREAMERAVEVVAKALEATTWIPCEERMPENGTYLCTVDGWFKYRKILNFAKDLHSVDAYDFINKKGVAGFYDSDSEYGYFEVPDVIAWMPLPEPYK